MSKLWFKRKKYGLGWQPCSKEGWFITIFFILYVFFLAYKYAEADMLRFFLYLAVSIVFFILIAYNKGEKPKWQWGNK